MYFYYFHTEVLQGTVRNPHFSKFLPNVNNSSDTLSIMLNRIAAQFSSCPTSNTAQACAEFVVGPKLASEQNPDWVEKPDQTKIPNAAEYGEAVVGYSRLSKPCTHSDGVIIDWNLSVSESEVNHDSKQNCNAYTNG
jgi:hypothetical protein